MSNEHSTPGEKVVTASAIGIVFVVWLVVIPALPILAVVLLVRSCG